MNQNSGALNYVQTVKSGGSYPRGMELVSTAANSANSAYKLLVGGQDSGNVAVFHVDTTTGFLLEETRMGGVASPVTFA